MSNHKWLNCRLMDIRERLADYCMPYIAEKIDRLGRISEDSYMPRKIDLEGGGTYQIGLFDDWS